MAATQLTDATVEHVVENLLQLVRWRSHLSGAQSLKLATALREVAGSFEENPIMTKAEAAKGIIEMMSHTALKLVRSRDLLNLEERFQVAETLRDAADALDQGKVLRAPPQSGPLRRVRRLVRAEKTQRGEPLYRIIG